MNQIDVLRAVRRLIDGSQPKDLPGAVMAIDAALAAQPWTPASTPPDADTTVMLALADGEVWQGYWDGGDWIEVSGLRPAPGRVTYWQHTPKHPEDQA